MVALNIVYTVVTDTSHPQSLCNQCRHCSFMANGVKEKDPVAYLFSYRLDELLGKGYLGQAVRKCHRGHGDRGQMLRMVETFY